MNRWQRYWSSRPLRVPPSDHLRQVGKTVGGNPISELQLEVIVESVSRALELGERDRLLDLCCGNGLLTFRLARRVERAVGIDFSWPLLDVARREFSAPTVHYVNASALEIDSRKLAGEAPFSKVLIYEALQHFRHRELRAILREILALTDTNPIIYLGSIPDRARRSAFHNTPKRKIVGILRNAIGRDAIGTWWTAALIAREAAAFGLRSQVVPQDPRLHTAHYRFDCRLSPAAAATSDFPAPRGREG